AATPPRTATIRAPASSVPPSRGPVIPSPRTPHPCPRTSDCPTAAPPAPPRHWGDPSAAPAHVHLLAPEVEHCRVAVDLQPRGGAAVPKQHLQLRGGGT